MNDLTTEKTELTANDFVTGQDVKWCPGCGDYSILKQVQTVFPELGIPKEKIVFISGIGCSSRFTYYMDTYGMHSIHGRALAIASGVKMADPGLSVWVVSGDGDALSIGGNHFIHFMRKNFNIKMLMFNNMIYSLTKGQYSPTSEKGKVTKTSPYGSLEEPFNSIELALGAKSTFVARTIDRDPKHMKDMIRRTHLHEGAAFVEIYQNCPVFNDGAFFAFTDKETKKEESIYVDHGRPLVFGNLENQGIKLDGLTPVVVNMNEDKVSLNELWIHDEHDKTKANILARIRDSGDFPMPFGVIYEEKRSTYDNDMTLQLKTLENEKGRLSLNKILSGEKTWEI